MEKSLIALPLTLCLLPVTTLAATPGQTPAIMEYLPVIAGVLGVFVLVVAIFFPILASGESKVKFVLGRDYLRLAKPQPTSSGDQVEVALIFSYPDPSSYHLEPVVGKWERGEEEGAQLVRIPYVLDPRQLIYAKAYYTARALGVLDFMHGALYDAIHISNRNLSSAEEMGAFFAEMGVDVEDFQRVFNSSVTQTEIKKAQLLITGYQPDKIPALVVNGLYLSDESTAGSLSKLTDIIGHLVARERGVTED